MKNEKEHYCIPVAEFTTCHGYPLPSVLSLLALCHEYIFRTIPYEKGDLESSADFNEHLIVNDAIAGLADRLRLLEDTNPLFDWREAALQEITKAFPVLSGLNTTKCEVVLHVRILG